MIGFGSIFCFLRRGFSHWSDRYGRRSDASGKKMPWGEIALESTSILTPVPLDDWKPTEEEYEGYTGNEGNTLERWYHRSAIVVWHRSHHFRFWSERGAANSPGVTRLAGRGVHGKGLGYQGDS